MEKIPVFKTLEAAYGFVFGKFLSLLGISWFSLLLLGIGFYLFFRSVFTAFPGMIVEENPAALLAILPILPLLILASFLLMCVVLVGMTSLALGKLRPPVFFYFSLAYPVWRLLIAMICVYFLLLGLVVGLALVIGLAVGGIGYAAGEMAGIGIAVLMSMVLAFIGVYFTVRLTFFLVPVTVAEQRRVVSRSWALSKGNFWRIIGVVGGVLLPMILVQLVVQAVLMIPVMMVLSQMPLPTQELSPEEGMAFVMQIFEAMLPFLLILVPVFLALYVAMYGLIAGASAFAYRALVGSPETTEEVFA